MLKVITALKSQGKFSFNLGAEEIHSSRSTGADKGRIAEGTKDKGRIAERTKDKGRIAERVVIHKGRIAKGNQVFLVSGQFTICNAVMHSIQPHGIDPIIPLCHLLPKGEVSQITRP